MPAISDKLTDGAKVGAGAQLVFYVPALRDSVAHDAIITQARTVVEVDEDTGAFTTPSLDPGPYVCGIRWSSAQPFVEYQIEVPSGAGPFPLWPLIDAGMPPPPPGAPGFVRNSGGIDRAEVSEMSAYSDLPKVPATIYFLFD